MVSKPDPHHKKDSN